MAKQADAPEPRSRPSEATLTVEQLAYETGMSVRNIRNHQSRGLLPPPEVRARTGYYGPEHVARLRLIQEMQGEGFKLSAISRLIGEHGADADRFVGLRQAVTAPFATEAPEVLIRGRAGRALRRRRRPPAGQGAEARASWSTSATSATKRPARPCSAPPRTC